MRPIHEATKKSVCDARRWVRSTPPPKGASGQRPRGGGGSGRGAMRHWTMDDGRCGEVGPGRGRAGRGGKMCEDSDVTFGGGSVVLSIRVEWYGLVGLEMKQSSLQWRKKIRLLFNSLPPNQYSIVTQWGVKRHQDEGPRRWAGRWQAARHFAGAQRSPSFTRQTAGGAPGGRACGARGGPVDTHPRSGVPPKGEGGGRALDLKKKRAAGM